VAARGYQKPANYKENRRDRRRAKTRTASAKSSSPAKREARPSLKIQQRSRWRRPDRLSYRAGSGRPCASVDRVTGSDGLNAIVDLNVSNGGKAAVREHGISGSRDVPRRYILAPPKPSPLVFAHEAGVTDCVDGQDRGEFSGSIQEMKAFDERCYFTPLGGRFGRIASRRRRTLPEPSYE
jgi:hypothetical protein